MFGVVLSPTSGASPKTCLSNPQRLSPYPYGVALNLTELETKTKQELVDVAKEFDIASVNGLSKHDLAMRIMQAEAEREGNRFSAGILDMANDGYGFLRTQGMRPSISDVYVSQTQIRRFALRVGDYVVGIVRPPKDSEKYFGLVRVDAVNGLDPEGAKRRPYFEQLTPIFPDEMVNLEEGVNNLSTRVIDLSRRSAGGRAGSSFRPRRRASSRSRRRTPGAPPRASRASH